MLSAPSGLLNKLLAQACQASSCVEHAVWAVMVTTLVVAVCSGAQDVCRPIAVYEVWFSTKAVQAYQPTSEQLSVVQDVFCSQQIWDSAVAMTQWMQPCTVNQRAEAVVRVWTACLSSGNYPEAKVLHEIISMCAASNLQDSLHSGLVVMLCQAHSLSVIPLT